MDLTRSLLPPVALAAGAIAPAQAGVPLARQLVVMGTEASVGVLAADRGVAVQASEAAVRALHAVERRLSTWRDDSALARANRAPVGQPWPLAPELVADLAAVAAIVHLTEGSFDPACGALVAAYGLRGGGRWPSEAERRRAFAATGWHHLELRGDTLVRHHAGVVIDEGAFGKGLGLDRAVAAAVAAGANAVCVDLGGQVVLHGMEQRIAIADPRCRQRAVVEVAVAAGSVATSGNGERAVLVGGRRVGHLLDPRRGEPAPDFGSITVIAASGLLADALSTGLFVQGPDAALAFAARHPGIEVLVLEPGPPGASLRLRASAGVRPRLRALVPDLAIASTVPPAAGKDRSKQP